MKQVNKGLRVGEDEKKVSAFTKNDIYYTDPMRISEQSQQTLEKN